MEYSKKPQIYKYTMENLEHITVLLTRTFPQGQGQGHWKISIFRDDRAAQI